DALGEISQLCRHENWRLAVWDVESGLDVGQQDEATKAGGQDPLAAIRALASLAQVESSAILVLVNFHRFLQSAEVVQSLVKQITAASRTAPSSSSFRRSCSFPSSWK